MKSVCKILSPTVFAFLSIVVCAQQNTKTAAADSARTNHIALENFPKDKIINHIDGWGGMSVAVNEMPAGTDLAPLLAGLKNNSCQVPHWGYIVKGSMKVKYDTGKDETLKAGDIFYMPPGHTGIVLEDLKIMDFSPEKEMADVIRHVEKKLSKTNQ